MSSLYVLLPPEPVTPESDFAYALSTDGHSVAAHASASAPLLPEARGAATEVVAIVPAAALSWHRIELPRGVAPGSTRLRAALEGLLEDQLLDEPETLHFALEPEPRPGATVWVAVCQRAWLRAALQALESAGRPASRVVPEIAPEAPGGLHVLGEPGQAQLIASGPEGVLSLPLSPGAQGLLPVLPEDALCFAEPAVSAQAEQQLQRPVVLQTAAQRWLQAAQSRWDLGQFDFASSGRARAIKRLGTLASEWLHAPQWRPVRWGLVALLLANLVGLNAAAWRERSALQNKEQAVRDTLTRSFPQVRLVVDAPVQMAREVAALRQATGTSSERDLEMQLSALAGVAGDRAIAGVDYANGELRVRGLGWTPAQVGAAQTELRRQGLAARLQGELLVLSPEAAP